MLSNHRSELCGFFLNRTLLLAVVLALTLGSCSGGSAPQNEPTEYTVNTYRLGEELSSRYGIQRFTVSSDHEWVVYHLTDNVFEPTMGEIGSLPIIGGPPVTLFDSNTEDERIRWYDITPDGQYVIIGILLGADNNIHIYSMPIGGSELVELTDEPMFYSVSSHFEISSDSRWVVYPADKTVDLRIVPVTGGPSKSLSGPMSDHALPNLYYFRISKDSKYVVYAAQYTGRYEALYSIPIEGGEFVQLSHEQIILPDREYVSYFITPDSSRVVYKYVTLDQVTNYYVASIPIAGGQTTNLKDSFRLPQFTITPDSRFILGLFPPSPGRASDLLAIPLNGGPVQNLSADLKTAGEVDSYAVTSDSRYVVFETDDGENGSVIFRVPIEGGQAVPLVTSLPRKVNFRFVHVGTESKYVLYNRVSEPLQPYDLFSVPLSGGTSQYLCSGDESRTSPDDEIVLCESGSIVPITGGQPLDITGEDLVMSWSSYLWPRFDCSAEDKRIVWASKDVSSKRALFVSVLNEKVDE